MMCDPLLVSDEPIGTWVEMREAQAQAAEAKDRTRNNVRTSQERAQDSLPPSEMKFYETHSHVPTTQPTKLNGLLTDISSILGVVGCCRVHCAYYPNQSTDGVSCG